MIWATHAHSLAPIQLPLALIAVIHCQSGDQKTRKVSPISIMAILPRYGNFVLIFNNFVLPYYSFHF